jgi:acetamidase/formamidase
MKEMVFHIFPHDRVHYKWDNRLAPVIRIDPGDTVVFNLREVSDDQITPTSTYKVLNTIDWNRIYPLSGPVLVEGAAPGDTLEVEILDVHSQGWGWSAIIPNFGLLQDIFRDPKLKIWDLSAGDYTYFRDDVKIPLDPFCGTMGVAPARSGRIEVMPPGKFGGNLDVRHLTQGAKLRLPVGVNGALFSVGDPHAAQGDGEVCVTGIEAPMHVSLRFNLQKKAELDAPQFITPGSLTSKYDAAGYYVTLGIDSNLMKAAQAATRQMVEYVSTTWKMAKWEAYMLSSIVVDLKINEIVDQPNWVVGAYLPLSIFEPV